MLYIDEQPTDVQLPSAMDLAVTETEPGLRGDTASGGGTKPATLETGREDPGAPVRQHRRLVSVDTRSGEYVSGRRRVRVRRTEQRRAAIWALYQIRSARSPAARRRSRGTRTRSPARSRRRCRSASPSSTSLISRHATGWSLGRIAPLERSILRVALLELTHPDAVPGETPIPPEGAIDEAVETAKRVLRRRGARLRQRDPRPRRCASASGGAATPAGASAA